MKKNSITSILAALKSYDGCEFDVRFTRDKVLVLYHNATYNQKRLINTDFKELRNIKPLEELINHLQVIKLVNNDRKTLWIEAKEDTTLGLKRDSLYCVELAIKLTKKIKNSDLDLTNIRIISFNTEILKHISCIRTLRIIPYLFTATDFFIPHYNIKTIIQMFISLRRHIQDTIEMGISGLLFSRLYLRGLFSLFHPSFEEINSLKKENFILGTDAKTLEEEEAFKDFVVITDFRGKHKNRKEKDEGLLICHRGL